MIQNGAIYHIVAKANRGEFIFSSDEMKEMFLCIMKMAKRKYDFKLTHYCIMSNHVHLIVEPGPGTNLSALMQWVLSVFARRYNIIHGIHGHVWYDRFKSKIIRSFTNFVNVFQYISNNPVKAGICENARTYAYGGLYELHKKHYRLLDPLDSWLNSIPV